MLIGPLVGRASDRFGILSTFTFGSIVGIVMAIVYTNLGITPLWLVILVNALMFVGIFSRMIPSQALMTAIPGAREPWLIHVGERIDAADRRRVRLDRCRHDRRANGRRKTSALRRPRLRDVGNRDHRARDDVLH